MKLFKNCVFLKLTYCDIIIIQTKIAESILFYGHLMGLLFDGAATNQDWLIFKKIRLRQHTLE